MSGGEAPSADAEAAVLLRRLDALRPRLDALPVAGGGATLERWRAFAALGRDDLSLARLAEGHAGARTILGDLGRPDLLTGAGRMGVWVADPDRLRAERTDDGWRLDGTKGWCSASTGLDLALVSATADDDGERLFAVSPAAPGITVVAGSWQPMGMVATRSDTLAFASVELAAGAALGGPGALRDRPGSAHGGAGATAVWWGGAVGVADGLRAALASGGEDVAAALGEATAELDAAWTCLADVAARIDAAPTEVDLARILAARARLVVEGAAQRTLRLTIDALGAEGLCHAPDHARRVADLTVYLAQLRRRPAAVALGRYAAAFDPLAG